MFAARAEQGLRRVVERDVEVVGDVAAGPEDRGPVEPDLHVFVMEQVESNDVPLADWRASRNASAARSWANPMPSGR